jgi:hypothetical protein
MSHWLIVYSRPSGTLLRCEEFADPLEALQERFAVEREHRGTSTIEVAVLGGDSLGAVKVTHARYFSSVPELAARLSALVSATGG